jgi:hypothetical protein
MCAAQQGRLGKKPVCGGSFSERATSTVLILMSVCLLGAAAAAAAVANNLYAGIATKGFDAEVA